METIDKTNTRQYKMGAAIIPIEWTPAANTKPHGGNHEGFPGHTLIIIDKLRLRRGSGPNDRGPFDNGFFLGCSEYSSCRGLVSSVSAVIPLGLFGDVSAFGAAALGFSPIKLALLLAWVYGCLFTVRWVSDHMSYGLNRTLLQLVSLVAGPSVALVFFLRRGGERDRKQAILHRVTRIKDLFLARCGLKTAPIEEDSRMRFFNSAGIELSEVYREGRGSERQVLEMAIQMIDDAVTQRASDVLLDPKDETAYAVRLRIDGVLRTVRELPTATAKAVVNIVKVAGSMDIAERRRPQDGAFTAKKGDVSISFRVASAGALNGEKISIRVLDQDIGRFSLVKLGIPERQRAVIGKAINKPSGMVLICGPTGSGKTTTMYSMLNQIDRLTHNVISVEDPIEARLPEVSQLEINPKAGITFAEALRSILRQDPDVICVGEIRDEETAEIAVRAAQTGHLVLATIHCESNATAIVPLARSGRLPLAPRLRTERAYFPAPRPQTLPPLPQAGHAQPQGPGRFSATRRRHQQDQPARRLQSLRRDRLLRPHGHLRRPGRRRRPAIRNRQQHLGRQRTAKQGRSQESEQPAQRRHASGVRRSYQSRRTHPCDRIDTMVFWLAVVAGALFVAIAVEWGFFTSWIMFLHLILAIYLAIFLTPSLADAVPAIAATSWGYALAMIAIAAATIAIGYGICNVGLGGEMGIEFPVAFDTLGAGLVGFMTGFLLASFLTFTLCLTPFSQASFCKKYGFDVNSQEANLAYVCRCCDILHYLVSSSDTEEGCWAAADTLLQLYERKAAGN